jgi:sal-like protein
MPYLLADGRCSKHERRHEKPYGCTINIEGARCKSSFGSKNDWIRHENTVHFQVENWICDVKKDGTNLSCGKSFTRRETFKLHLTKDHLINEQSALEDRWERCQAHKIGKETFWCGFCRSEINNKKNERGQYEWGDRFDHIEAHFMGRMNYAKSDIESWQEFDANAQASPSSRRRGLDDGSDAGGGASRPKKRSRSGHEQESRPRKRNREDGSGHNDADMIWNCVCFPLPDQQKI